MNTAAQTIRQRLSQDLIKLGCTFKAMVALEPVMANLITIVLCGGSLYLLRFPHLLPNLGKYHAFLACSLQGLIAYQVIRSATQSLLLPLLAMIIAGVGIWLSQSDLGTGLPVLVLSKDLLLVGILGIGVFSIFG